MLREDHGRPLSGVGQESSMTVPALGRSSIYYGSTASGFNVSLLRIQAIPILLQRLAPLCRRPVLFVSIRMAGFRTRSSTVFLDRKSTRLNSSHSQISYAVFCLKKKKKN